MAKKLSPVIGQIVWDLNKWSAGVKQIQRDQAALQKAVKPLSDAFGAIGKPMLAVGGALSALFVGLAKKAADYGDEMLEASQKTGIGTKQLSALRLVAEQSGSSFDGLIGAQVKLSKSLFEAATKGGESAKVFKALGIDVKDAGGNVRNASEVFPEFAERISKMAAGTEKAALVVKVLGKNGAELIPTLNQGAAGFLNAAQAIEKFSVDIGDAGNKLGDEFNDQLKLTGLATQGLANQIGVALLPAMIKMVAIGNNVIAMVSRWAKEHPTLTRYIAATAGVMTGAGGLLIAMSLFLKYSPGMIGNIKLMGAAFMGLSVPMRIVIGAMAILTAAFIAFPATRGPILDFFKAMYKGAVLVYNSLYNIGQLIGSGLTGQWMQFLEQLRTSNSRVNQEVLKAEKDFDSFTAAVGKGLKDMNSALTTDLPDIKLPGVDLGEFGKDVNKAKELIDQMWASLQREGTESGALQVTLLKAEQAGISLDTVLDKLGPTIADVTDEFIKAGIPIPDIIAKYNFLRKNSLELTAQYEQEMEARQRLNKLMFEAAHRTVELMPASIAEELPEMDDFTKNIQRLGEQKADIRDLAGQMTALARAGFSTAEIESMLGHSMEDVLEDAKRLGVALNSLEKKTLEQGSAAKKMSESWGATFARISDDLVDMIVDFDFSMSRLKSIGLDTAKSLARSFLDGFFKPFRDGLESLGKKAGEFAAGLLFGKPAGGTTATAAGGGGGLLGGLLGSLGGIFNKGEGEGGKSGGLGGILGGIFGGGSPVIHEGGGMGGAGGSAAMMNPWLALAGPAIGGLTSLIGAAVGRKTHDAADDIVHSQNAFVNQTLKGILDDADLSATNKLKMVNNAWDDLLRTWDNFAGTDTKNQIVESKAFASVSPLVSQIQQDLMRAGATTTGDSGDGSGIHIENVYIQLSDVVTPDQLNRWINLDAGGFRTAIITAVDKSEGLVTAH